MGILVSSWVVFEDATAVFVSRMQAADGDPAVQADVSSISYAVYDRKLGTEVISGTLTVSSVVYDTLQTGSIWTRDDVGYNFKYALPTTAFPTGGRSYRVEFKWTFADGTVGIDAYDCRAEAIYIS